MLTWCGISPDHPKNSPATSHWDWPPLMHTSLMSMYPDSLNNSYVTNIAKLSIEQQLAKY